MGGGEEGRLQSAPSVNKWRVLAFTSLGHLVNDGWVMFIPTIADIIVNADHTPLFVVTLISVSFYSSSALLNFVIGHAAGRGSQGDILARGIGLISLTSLGFVLALASPGGELLYFVVAAVSVLVGLGSASYHPVAAVIIQTSFDPGESGRAMGINGAFGGVGSAIFPPLFFAMAFLFYPGDSGGTAALSVALLVMSAIGVVGAVSIWRGLRGYTIHRDAARGARRSGMREALTRGIVVLTVVTAVRSIANTGVSVWLPIYITSVRGEGVGPILGFTLAATYLGAIPGQIFFGTLVERLDKRAVLGASSAGAALAVLGYVYSGGYLALAFISLFGFFSYSSFPTLLSLAADYVPRSSWSAANGFVWGFGIMGGNVLGPALTEFVIGEDYTRLTLAFVLLAVIGLAGAAVTPLMTKPTHRMGEERKTIEVGKKEEEEEEQGP